MKKTVFMLMALTVTGCVSFPDCQSSDDVSISIVSHCQEPWVLTLSPYDCIRHNLREEDAPSRLNVDFFVLIDNHTDKSVAFGAEPYSCGYYCLELDIRLVNGQNLSLKKKKPIWEKNVPEIILIPPHDSILYPVTVDRHLWECSGGMDSFPLIGDIISIRARFMGCVLVDGHVFVPGGPSAKVGRQELTSEWKTIRMGCAEVDNYLKYRRNNLKVKFRRVSKTGENNE